jgi:ribonuclease HI
VEGGVIFDPKENKKHHMPMELAILQIIRPKGKQETSYAYGIGNTSNNQTQALAFWIGVWIMKNQGIKKMIVVGDSIIVIHHMVFKTLPKTPILNLDRLLCCTQKLLKGIEGSQISSCHERAQSTGR